MDFVDSRIEHMVFKGVRCVEKNTSMELEVKLMHVSLESLR